MTLRAAASFLGGLSLVSIALLALDLFTHLFGKTINAISPCKDIMTNSTPCYMVYDGAFILTLSIIAAVSLVVAALLTAIADTKAKPHASSKK